MNPTMTPPEPPADLTAEEAKVWRSIARDLPARLHPADLIVLHAFCTATVLMHEARDSVRREGLVLPDARGRPRANPAIAVMSTQAQLIARLRQTVREIQSR